MTEDYADRRRDEGEEVQPQGDPFPEATSTPAPEPAAESVTDSAAAIAKASWLQARATQVSASRDRRLDSARSWWSAATPNMRGSLLMVLAFIFFAVMMTLIKLVGARISIVQILVTRQLVMTLILALVVRQALPVIMHTQRPALQLMRGLCSLGSMLCGFTALIHLPMAEATALGFSQVLFVTLLAIFVLYEVVDRRRWIAMAVGFLGVLVMLRPTSEALNVYALLAIAGALFGAGITVAVRVLGDGERTETILFWQGAIISLALIGPTILLWIPPTPTEWMLMLGLSIVGTAGQWFITRAYQVGEASALAPLDFVRLLLATAGGYLVFAEIPSLITVLGAVLVAGGTIYTMRRNAGPRAAAIPPVD